MPVGPLLKFTGCFEKASPHNKLVPKDRVGNLRFRQSVLERAATDAGFRAAMVQACREDVLFWYNTFAWTYDPRMIAQGRSPKLPFITWPYQDEAILAMNQNVGVSDLLIEKSRDMGASWLNLSLFFYRWQFFPLHSFLMVSRKEGLVDGARDSLFGHIDFILNSQPSWMRLPARRKKLYLENLVNGSIIEGESTTTNIGRGGRRSAILLDEFAAFEGGGFDVLSATADTTDCRVFNSTPNGTGNAFYAQRMAGTPRLRFHWSLHPKKGAGLYRVTGRHVEVLDRAYYLKHPDYEFVKEASRGEEGLRSPWYDRECQRRAHKVEIATQLDIDYQGSAFPFFDPMTLSTLEHEQCQPPIYVGMLDAGSFTEREDGHLKLWCQLEDLRPDPRADYVVACDISQGSGASNSVAVIGSRSTGEKIGEFASNRMPPERFADFVVDLCRYFRGSGSGAFLIWEATGPGMAFGSRITDHHHYYNIYYHRDDTKVGARPTGKPGWWTLRNSKISLLANYRAALVDRKFINPSRKALQEAGEYVYTPTGEVVHGGSVNTVDPSDSGASHGDRVIADALLCKVIGGCGQRQEEAEGATEVEGMSVLSRRRMTERQLASSSLFGV